MNRRLVVFIVVVAICAGALLVAPERLGADEHSGNHLTIDELAPKDILLNTVLPGYAQIRLGSVRQGVGYLMSLPLTLAGLSLQTHYLFAVMTDDELQRFSTGPDGGWYIYYLDGLNDRPEKWEFYLGTILGLYGTLLSTHSQYDLQNRFADASGRATFEPLSLKQALVAPWQPRNLLNMEILPVFALSILPDLALVDRETLDRYFSRESVSFLGAEVSPGAGLALAAGSAVLIANANAVWEEIAYRGLQLRARGIVGSSLSFGLVHLPNALMPNVSVQDTLWQSTFATMFGLYAASVTHRDGGDFRKAISWHFWNNVLAFTLGYLIEPDNQPFFGVGVDLKY